MRGGVYFFTSVLPRCKIGIAAMQHPVSGRANRFEELADLELQPV
jgi:hypothetical protein